MYSGFVAETGSLEAVTVNGTGTPPVTASVRTSLVPKGSWEW